MSYDSNLIRFKELKASLPDNRLIQVCVDRYEINLIKFKLTECSKYEIILNALGKILDTFMNINFRSRL